MTKKLHPNFLQDPVIVDGRAVPTDREGYLQNLDDWSPDFARLEMPIAAFHGNRHGLPHGGVYATLLDTAMGYCGCFTGSAEVAKFIDRQLANSAPAAMLIDSSAMRRSGSTDMRVPSPEHSGHAPNGALNEKVRGSISVSCTG